MVREAACKQLRRTRRLGSQLRFVRAGKAMSPLAKGLGALFGLPIVLAIIFFTYFNLTGEDRMRAICSQVKPGMTGAQLKQFVLDNRLNNSGAVAGTSFLADSRSYGRHTCRVTMDAGVVKEAEYNFAD